MFNLMTESFERIKGKYPGEGDGDSVNGSTHGMNGFFKQVAEVEKHIEEVSTQLDKLQAANQESKQVTKASAMKAIKERMEKDIGEVAKIVIKVKASLEALDKDNLANRRKPGCEAGTSVDRSRTAMTAALRTKLKERMSQFQILRQNIQDEYREVVERRVFTVTGTHPGEETIDDLIETGNSEKIFANAIGQGQIMDTLAEIQERRDTVLEIERMLLDLHQAFMDMAVVVDSQGEMLDDIEAQVVSSVDHVQKATMKLQEAKKIRNNTRKYLLIALIVLIVIIIIALIPLFKKGSDDPSQQAQNMPKQT
ncbi:uncharacterized protein A4U43_C07F19550 [Asparagus officinalis]|uniref:t-SNARE coiled-coil homology domain-containing protein n=1 Tax=Asparagus officinalis TaxID=4686 RepID=A0A5P1EF54_ASPOF|nr:syntaxin-132-like [Asparagus officinalis]ONK63847.1 uncharacterized protein A4U43_C07F19550 [Asparagus officinalis]